MLLAGKQNATPTMDNTMVILKTLKMELPYDPAVPLVGIYAKEMKSIPHRDIHIPLFIAAVFTIAIYRIILCPLTNEWIKK